MPVSNARFIVTKSQESLDSRHEGDKSLLDSGKCRQLGTGQDKLPEEQRDSPIVGATRVPRLLVVSERSREPAGGLTRQCASSAGPVVEKHSEINVSQLWCRPGYRPS